MEFLGWNFFLKLPDIHSWSGHFSSVGVGLGAGTWGQHMTLPRGVEAFWHHGHGLSWESREDIWHCYLRLGTIKRRGFQGWVYFMGIPFCIYPSLAEYFYLASSSFKLFSGAEHVSAVCRL